MMNTCFMKVKVRFIILYRITVINRIISLSIKCNVMYCNVFNMIHNWAFTAYTR